jgi:microsomal dipeptidase-like Zn-dependent dipeptidase
VVDVAEVIKIDKMLKQVHTEKKVIFYGSNNDLVSDLERNVKDIQLQAILLHQGSKG